MAQTRILDTQACGGGAPKFPFFQSKQMGRSVLIFRTVLIRIPSFQKFFDCKFILRQNYLIRTRLCPPFCNNFIYLFSKIMFAKGVYLYFHQKKKGSLFLFLFVCILAKFPAQTTLGRNVILEHNHQSPTCLSHASSI